MCLMGTIKDGKLVLDEPAALPDGTRVQVAISPVPDAESTPRKGSPEAILRLAGTITQEEAEHFLRVSEECRRIDADLWDEHA
jgi:hypothetical protein